MLESVFADVMARAITDHQEFGGGDAAAAFSGEQDLGVNGGEGYGELLANSVLAFERERIGDAGNGGRHVDGVKC